MQVRFRYSDLYGAVHHSAAFHIKGGQMFV